MKPKKHRLIKLTPLLLALCAATNLNSHAIDYIKDNNGTALTTSGSYTIAGVPGASDTLVLDSTITTTFNSVSLAISGGLSILGIRQDATAVSVPIIGSGAANALTLGTDGILKNATALMRINAQVTLSGNQTWNVNAGTLRTSGAYTLTTGGNTLAINGAGTFEFNTNAAGTLGSGVTIDVGTVSVTGGSSSALTLGGVNTFNSLSVSGGRVIGSSFGNFGVASNFGDGGTTSVITMGGSTTTGIFQYTGNTASSNRTFFRNVHNTTGTENAVIEVSTAGQTLTLSGTLSSNAGGPTINSGWRFGGAGNLTIQGIINDQTNTSVTSVTKADAGTVTLTAANTYEGVTTVSGGTLLVNNASGSGLGTGNAIVNGGKLGGTGGFTGAVTVNAGGTLSPGASIETLGSGALTLNNDSAFEYEVNSGVATSVGADLQKVTGALNLNSVVTLTLTDLNLTPTAFAIGTTFTLINYTGSWNNGLFTYNSSLLADGASFTAGLNTWEIDYNATSQGLNFVGEQTAPNFVNITVVPEPTTSMLIVVGGLASMVFRRRRRA